MKFTSRVDLAVPAENVFSNLADVAQYEALAKRKRVILRRLDTLAQPGVGMSWTAQFRFRGRERLLEIQTTRFEPHETLEYEGRTSGFEMVVMLQILALSRTRSRLNVALEVKPRTLGARLLLQSARLGRSSLERKFDAQVANFGRKLEGRVATV